MQSFIINMVVVLIGRLLEKSTWNRLRELIIEADEKFSDSTPGDEKRTWVLTHLSSSVTWLINLALEALVAQKKVG